MAALGEDNWKFTAGPFADFNLCLFVVITVTVIISVFSEFRESFQHVSELENSVGDP